MTWEWIDPVGADKARQWLFGWEDERAAVEHTGEGEHAVHIVVITLRS